MGLVDEEDEVVGEVVDQRVGRAARRAAVEDPRVVLDPRAEAELPQHLHVVAGPLLEAVRLELLAVLLEVGDLVAHLALDLVDGALHRLLLDDVVARRPDGDVVDHIEDLARQRVEVLDRLDLVAEELDPVRGLGIRREDLEHLSAGAERAARQVLVVPPVLHPDQLAEDVLAVDPVPHLEELHLLAVEVRRADPVDAGDRGDNDHVVAREQRGRRGVAEPVDLIVDRGVLLDVEVLRRDVGLGLVVVVVADEVLDGVVREELPELVAELRRQRLVVRDHQRRALDPLDRRRHREGLAGAGRAKQRLDPLLRAEPLGQTVDGLRLVRCRRICGVELELRHVLSLAGPPHATFRMVSGGCGGERPTTYAELDSRPDAALRRRNRGDRLGGDGRGLRGGDAGPTRPDVLRRGAPLRAVCLTGLEPGSLPRVQVQLDGERVWPPAGRRASRRASCGRSAPAARSESSSARAGSPCPSVRRTP